jgi:hypothetical protein
LGDASRLQLHNANVVVSQEMLHLLQKWQLTVATNVQGAEQKRKINGDRHNAIYVC